MGREMERWSRSAMTMSSPDMTATTTASKDTRFTIRS